MNTSPNDAPRTDPNLASKPAPAPASEVEKRAEAPTRTVPDAPSPRHVSTLTNSPGCRPSEAPETGAPRRLRAVRVDAWAVPASVSWSRPRTTPRRAASSTRALDRAVPV